MTFAPQTIKDLAALWVANEGEDLGIIGDSSHAATGGYHEGKDDLLAAGVLATDYSVQQDRDKAGLSNAAAALDLGKLNGSYDDLRAFSRWIVTTLPVNGIVREVIYTPDGVTVQRWSGVDGQIHTGPGNGDSSHLWHTHISFFRDTEFLAKTQLFAPYFATAPAPEAPMPAFADPEAAVGTVKTKAVVSVFNLRTNSDGPYGAGDTYSVFVKATMNGSPVYLGKSGNDVVAFPESGVDFTATDAPTTTPTTATEAQKQYDLDAATLVEHLLGKRP